MEERKEESKGDEKNPEGWFEEVPLEGIKLYIYIYIYIEWPEPVYPKVADTEKSPLPGLSSTDSLINILSFLPILELTRLMKSSRGLYHFIKNDDFRKRIMNWEMSKDDEDAILGYQIRLMPTVEVYK